MYRFFSFLSYIFFYSTIAGIPGEPGFLDGSARAAMFNSPSNIILSHTGNHALIIERGMLLLLAGALFFL